MSAGQRLIDELLGKPGQLRESLLQGGQPGEVPPGDANHFPASKATQAPGNVGLPCLAADVERALQARGESGTITGPVEIATAN